jgi:uncharacterized protein (TIGR03545 family)
MKSKGRIIRVQGLAVFVVVAGLIGAFFVMFLDGIIKGSLEDQGSNILKAQLDVGSLSTSLMSQSMDIENIQIANADQLDENVFEAGRIKFDFDGGRALSKKVIIDDMRLEGLRFNEKRKSPAKPYQPKREDPQSGKPAVEEKSSDGLDVLKGLEFKNPKDILKNETLETLEAVEKTKGDLETLKSKWQTQIDQQLNKESIAEIKQRLKDLKAKGKNLKDPLAIKAFIGEIQTLRNDIQSRLATIKHFKRDLEADIKNSKTLAVNLKNLPKKDFDRLKKKYSLDLKGGSGLAGQMISGPLKSKIDKAWSYYKKISPYLKSDTESEPEPEEPERGKGRFIKFPSANPFPDFLIRNASLSMNVQNQDIAGDFQGLTNDPKLYGKPFQLNIAGNQTDAFKKFQLNLVMDRTRAETGDTLDAQVDDFKINPVPFGNWATLTKGLADFKGHIEIRNEKNLTGDFRVNIHGASFANANETKDEMSRLLGKVLQSVNQFYVQVGLKGTLGQYTLDIQSDLDQILANSVRKLFDEKVKTFEEELKKSIAKSTNLPISDAGGLVSGLKDYRSILKDKESAYKDLLNQATKKALLGKAPGGDTLLKKFKLPF